MICIVWGGVVVVFSTGDQLVPLEGPRTLDPVCRDEDKAGQLQKF